MERIEKEMLEKHGIEQMTEEPCSPTWTLDPSTLFNLSKCVSALQTQHSHSIVEMKERLIEVYRGFTNGIINVLMQRSTNGRRSRVCVSVRRDILRTAYYLQARRLKCDLQMCYKVIHNQIFVLNDDFLVFADCTSTRGHCYKLYKGYSQVNTHKYFFANRICDIWKCITELSS